MTATTTPPPSPGPGVHRQDTTPSFWRRRGIRTTWVVLGSLFTVTALAWGTLESVALLAHDETVDELSWDAAGITTVEIHNSAGDVQVVGSDTDTIELTSRISRGLFDTRHDERVDGDRLILTTDCPEIVNHFCTVDQSLVVPHGVGIELVTHDGNTEIADVDGHVDLYSEDGRVDLVRLGGTLDVEVRHGSADGTQLTSSVVTTRSDYGRVRLSFTDPPDLVDVEAHFGSVEVLVPDDETFYAVTSTSNFGNTDNQLRSDPAAEARITVSVQFGTVRLGYTS